MRARAAALLALFLAAAAPAPGSPPTADSARRTATADRAGPPPSADAGGPITPADIMRLRDMRDVEMSPDGRTILFTVTAQMATFGSPQSTVYTVPADGSAPARPLLVSAGIDASPRWSPDGRRIAFLSNRSNPLGDGKTGFAFKPQSDSTPGTPLNGTEAVAPPPAGTPGGPSRQLWLIDRDEGQAAALTALPGDIADFAWSPDGTRIAFLSADPDTAAQQRAIAAKDDGVEVDRTRHHTRAWILDLATHSARRVSPAGVSISALDWSPDGTRLAVRATDSAAINDYFYHSRIALLDPQTATLGLALIEHAADGPHWSRDGRSLLAEVIRTPGFIGLGVRVHDLASGRTRALADDHHGLLTNVAWAPDGTTITALSFEHTRSIIVRIDAADGTITGIAPLDGEASDISFSADGRRLAVAASTPSRPAEVFAGTDGILSPVSAINPMVAAWRLGAVREVSWPSKLDGRTIYGVLVTPPGYVAGTPIKTVVQVHGGPEWAWWSGWLGSWHEWAQLLATHGYAVLLPNIRGSDGQGTDFARAVGSDWGGADYQDMLDGVDMLVARRVADPQRLGIGGWSYGGFMSAWAVTHGNRFKAAVVGAGPTDMAAMALITDTPDFTTGYFGPPSTALPTLDRVSSARLLPGVQTPVLVLHGDADTRVPATLGLQFYRGLVLLGKPAEMVRYPREPHWFHEPAHQEDLQRRVLDWFDRHL